MNLCLFKLRFLTPVHIGSGESARSLETQSVCFGADTLFSALCHTIIRSEGKRGINRLYNMAVSGKVLFSDAMPYSEGSLYLPKPCMSAVYSDTPPENLKKIKKLRFIPAGMFDEYIKSVTQGVPFAYEEAQAEFGTESVAQKVSLRSSDKPEPYLVGIFTFYEGSGLYIIAQYENDADIEYIKRLVKLLGYTGIGGELSAGYGKFEADFIKEPDVALSSKFTRGGDFMTLCASLPKDGELDGAMNGSSYTLLRRGGFIQSADFAPNPVKKQTQYFFAAGSVFKKRFEGDVYNAAPGGAHPVYRYAKPMFLGVGL